MIDRESGLVVRKQITVRGSQERAFAVFTEFQTRWWPQDKQLGAQPMQEVVLEPRQGGRWFERAADGSECDWGHVRVWDPPARVVLVWQISAQWAYDAALNTEVDVRFIPEAPERTRVELEHRGLEAYGEGAAEMRAIFDSPGGWTGVLDSFAAVTTTDEEQT